MIVINDDTLRRIVKNFAVYQCMGDCGSLNKAARSAYLKAAQQLGYLTSECVITEKGKDYATD